VQESSYALGRVRWGLFGQMGGMFMMFAYLVDIIELLDALCFCEGFEA